jgi:hypothetical protein
MAYRITFKEDTCTRFTSLYIHVSLYMHLYRELDLVRYGVSVCARCCHLVKGCPSMLWPTVRVVQDI